MPKLKITTWDPIEAPEHDNQPFNMILLIHSDAPQIIDLEKARESCRAKE